MTPQALHGQRKIISYGKIIAVAADKTKLMALDPQLPATRALPYAGVRKSLPVRNPVCWGGGCGGREVE